MYKPPKLGIANEMVVSIAYIEEQKGYWNCVQKLCNLQEGLDIEDIVKSSTYAVSNAVKHVPPVDMAGFSRALKWILTDYKSITLSAKTIDKLYNFIELQPQNSNKEEGLDLYRELNSEEGGTVDKDSTLQEMTDWVNSELESGKIHPLLVISAFTGEFLHLRPYPIANSRISRLLSTLLLLKTGYTYGLLVSLDSIIEKEYESYKPAYDNSMSIGKFNINFWNVTFLKILESHARIVEKLLSTIEASDIVVTETIVTERTVRETPTKPRDVYTDLPALQVKILKMFDKDERITISHVVNTTKANLNTIKKHLAALSYNNLIEKHGKTRGAWYTKSN